jgi:predicted regulator of Ras-like GTPase activity (Roadblock/LC7/MglB family)
MPNFVKSKFTGLLKGLLRRFDDGETKTVPPPMPTRTAAHPAPAPAAVPPPRPQVAPPSSTFTPAKAKTVGELQLPLQPIIASLPMELRAKIAQQPAADATFSVPADKVLMQLAHGAVKITFGELRLAVPGLFINSGGENDSRPITLPLSLILPQISPSLLARRPAQKLEVSDEITGPFGTRAEGVNFSSTPTKAAPTPLPKGSDAPVAPATPLPVTPPPTFTPRTAPAAAPAPTAPVPAAKTASAAPTPLPKPSAAAAPKPMAPAPPKPAAPAPAAPAPAAPLASPKPIAATPPPTTMAPVPASVPTPEPAARVVEPPAPLIEPSAPIPFSLTPASSAGGFNSAPRIPIAAELTVAAPLAALLETWPDALKQEIVESGMSGAEVALPLTLIEPGLKRGRITVTWKTLRGMIRPTPPPVSVHDTVEVELPLKVIAPLFFSSQKAAGQAKQKISVSAEIPNLFSGSKHSEPAMAPLPAPTAPPPPPTSGSAASSWGDLFTAPAGTPARTVTAAAPTGFPPTQLKSEDTNYYGKVETGAGVSDTEFRRQASPGTDFLTRGASPKEIIAQTVALPGVTGAVIALPDGLKVASEVPPEFNADMLAAFLPQIFARTGQSTKELRMGELNNLSFTVGNVPWKVFRVNAVYFAAFGRAGEPLPTAQLASLAVLLDRKNK